MNEMVGYQAKIKVSIIAQLGGKLKVRVIIP